VSQPLSENSAQAVEFIDNPLPSFALCAHFPAVAAATGLAPNLKVEYRRPRIAISASVA
jgi:hypothetical protein